MDSPPESATPECVSTQTPDATPNVPSVPLTQTAGSGNQRSRFVRWKPLTPFELISIVFACLGLLSLWFLWDAGVQQSKALEQQSETLENSARQVVFSQPIEVDKLFLQNPDLRKYFYENRAIQRDDANYDRVMALADLILDSFDVFFSQGQFLKELQEDTPAFTAWSAYIHDMYATSPALRVRLDEVSRWYSPDFREFMKQRNE